jgi:hypothetical protein
MNSATSPFEACMTAPTDNSVYTDIPRDQVKSSRVLALDHYWHSKHAMARLPSRTDIDPTELRHFLRGMLLADILEDPFNVFYRLCGTEVAEMRGELTGHTVRDWPHWDEDERAQLLSDYFLVVSQRRAVFSWDRVRLKSGSWSYFYSGIWPLSSDGIHIDKCLAYEDFFGINPADVWRPTARPAG